MAKNRQTLKKGHERPRYQEAYPQLDIMQAKAAYECGDTICEFTDRFDEPIGVARFDLRGELCQVEYEVRIPFAPTCTAWDTFELAPVQNGIVKKRMMILCPSCKMKRKILLFKDRWSCASCLALSFRSQLIHPLSRKWENFDALTNRLKVGKPHGMQNKTYLRLLSKLETLQHKVYGTERCYASDKYSDFVKCIWRSPVPKDEFVFRSIQIEATFRKQVDALRELATRAPIRPIGSNDGKREFRDGFETSDPDDL